MQKSSPFSPQPSTLESLYICDFPLSFFRGGGTPKDWNSERRSAGDYFCKVESYVLTVLICFIHRSWKEAMFSWNRDKMNREMIFSWWGIVSKNQHKGCTLLFVVFCKANKTSTEVWLLRLVECICLKQSKLIAVLDECFHSAPSEKDVLLWRNIRSPVIKRCDAYYLFHKYSSH